MARCGGIAINPQRIFLQQNIPIGILDIIANNFVAKKASFSLTLR
jgi:hypothetical protein